MRRLALLVAALVLLPVGPAFAAEGDPVTGYWSRTRLGPPVPLEAPTPVPEGGTWVASDPTGPVAVSALRLALAPGTAATALKLQVDRVQGTPAIRLCPAVARWQPQQGGPIETAPAHDCKVSLKTKIENGALVVALPPGFTLDALDVVLTPEPGSAFSATFTKATAQSVTVTSSAPPPDEAPAPAPAPPPPGLSSEGTALPPIGEPAGLAPAPALGPPAVTAPQAAPAPVPVAAPAPEAPAQSVSALPAAPDDRREAIPAAALLALLAAFALWLRLQPAAEPRRLGGGAGLRTAPVGGAAAGAGAGAGAGDAGGLSASPIRGVGRFRGVRTTRPVRL